jgi:hypothetical protein
MMAEAGEKNERKTAGLTAINAWHQERNGQIALRKQNNEGSEQMFQTKREEERNAGNPWERVLDNCDVSQQGVVAGGTDKSRMKHAMLNRKSDLAAGETVASAFRTNAGGL